MSGPYTPAELVRLAASGELTPEDSVRRGEGGWKPAAEVRGLTFAGEREAAATFAEALEEEDEPEEAPSSPAGQFQAHVGGRVRDGLTLADLRTLAADGTIDRDTRGR